MGIIMMLYVYVVPLASCNHVSYVIIIIFQLCQPAVDAAAFESMVQKASEQLFKDYERLV